MRYRVEALERFTVKTLYFVDAETADAAEALCIPGDVAYDAKEICDGDEEWLETLSVEPEDEPERMLNIEYRCPECGHEWQEQWSCACDSKCPQCGASDIQAKTWEDVT